MSTLRFAARPRRRAALGAIGLTTILLAACSASASPASPTQSESPAASVAETAAEGEAPSAAASEAPLSGNVTVTISGRSFGPDITIVAGTTVTFVNNDPMGHTVTNGTGGQAAPDALFDETIADGASVEIVFDTPGTYDVTCRIHSTMQMTITVV